MMGKEHNSFNMVSELFEFKGHLPIHAPSPKNVGHEGVYWEKLKSHIR